MSTDRDTEIDRNLFAFQTMVGDLLNDHRGQYALLKNRSLISIHDSLKSAIGEGHDRYGDSPFSIQPITDQPIDLGFFSHAAHPG